MLAFFWLVAATLLLFAYCLSTLFRSAAAAGVGAGGLPCPALWWRQDGGGGRQHANLRTRKRCCWLGPARVLPLTLPTRRSPPCSKARVAGGAAAVLYALAMMPG